MHLRLRFIALSAIALCGVSRLSHADSGRVIDEDTKEPLEGVYVMEAWNASAFNPVHSASVCYHFEVTRTDADGGGRGGTNRGDRA